MTQRQCWSLWTVVVLLLAAGCGLLQRGERVITGSGRVTTEARTVAGIERVALEGLGEVELHQGAAEALTIEAEDNLLPLITSVVDAGTLRLGFDRATWRDTLRPTAPIRFVLTVRDLEAFDLSGSGSLHASSLQASRLSLRLSGAGDLTVDHLESSALDVRIEGTGSVSVAGQAAEQTLAITGSGQYHAGDLDTQTTSVTISGSGDAVVWARDDLSIDISGSGTVSYWGDPHISRREIGGTGDINPMGEK
jgi:hypothetical protein